MKKKNTNRQVSYIASMTHILPTSQIIDYENTNYFTIVFRI